MVLGGLPYKLRQRGVTLIEMVVAVAMAGLVVSFAFALFKEVGGATRLWGGRMGAGFKSQALFSSLSRNLKYGQGVIRLSPSELDLLNVRGKRMKYRWGQDSAVTVNGKALDFKLASLAVEAYGPPVPVDRDGEPDWNAAPALDSLDENRDGVIDFDELDRDKDGELDLSECRFIGRVRISLVVALGEDFVAARTVIVHPRNHARDTTGTFVDTSGQSDPFP